MCFVEFCSFFPCSVSVRVLSDARPSRSACWWQELERRARERYGVLDHLDADLHWYRGQYEALDALVEALRSPDRWLAYRAEALLDLPPEQGAQAAEGASAVERVRTVLVERDDALRRAREDLEGARSLTSTWEAEVATARAQLQQGRAALQEAKGLKTALADKAAALTTAEEQLRQERAARQEAEGQLQRERAALVEARGALEQERMAHEEALGQLQRERAVLEEERAALQKQEEKVSRLNGELVQISISHEDQRQSLEEQEPRTSSCSVRLRRHASPSRWRRSRLKVSLFPFGFRSLIRSFGIWSQLHLFLVRGFQGCGPPWGTRPPKPRP
jgi:chromosome segregation ATPase